MKRILSLGAGVQSSTVLLMSCLGELPKLDCAIFADTGWEPRAVYDWLGWLVPKAAEYGIPVHRVSVGRSLRDDTINRQVAYAERENVAEGEKRKRVASMPLFVLGQDGSKGMLPRQCTSEFKIEPIEKFIKTEILGLQPRGRWPKEQAVQQWYGISADEFRRCRKPSTPWKSHFYPLCDREFFSDGQIPSIGLTPHSRGGCLLWCESHGFPKPPRSACIGCPFRNDAEWHELKKNPDEWQDAVEVDAKVRKMDDLRGEAYLHANRLPLDRVQLDPKQDYPMFQCEDGVCGL